MLLNSWVGDLPTFSNSFGLFADSPFCSSVAENTTQHTCNGCTKKIALVLIIGALLIIIAVSVPVVLGIQKSEGIAGDPTVHQTATVVTTESAETTMYIEHSTDLHGIDDSTLQGLNKTISNTTQVQSNVLLNGSHFPNSYKIITFLLNLLFLYNLY